MKVYSVTRDVPQDEPFNWAGRDVRAGEFLFEFLGTTYGCCDEVNGVVVTWDPDGGGEFFEFPRTAVRVLVTASTGKSYLESRVKGETMAPTTTQPVPQLLAIDECDKCGTQARVRLTRAGKVLDFCGHDYRIHEDALVLSGWEIGDDARPRM